MPFSLVIFKDERMTESEPTWKSLFKYFRHLKNVCMEKEKLFLEIKVEQKMARGCLFIVEFFSLYIYTSLVIYTTFYLPIKTSK